MSTRKLCAILLAGAAAAAATPPAPEDEVYAADWRAVHARCRPVPLTHVHPAGFLGRHIDLNRRSILKGLDSPVPRRFEARAEAREPGPETNRLAADSDLYKWIESAAYMVAATGDKEIERQLDRIAALVVASQKPDGYINTQVPPNIRFDPKVSHELYTAGHFFEAAAARFRATGKRDLLDAAARWADYLIAEQKRGNPYFQTVAEKEHSEYELGFLRLYRATAKKEYLEFAQSLARLIPVGPDLFSGAYAARAHAVRVNYLLSGYADLYLETGRDEFRRSLAGVWEDIVPARSYVTGGVSVHERYRAPYDLPQVTDHEFRDISETCTSISLMMFAWRMHAITGDTRYFDQLETILYNHFLGGVSLDHLGTFYYNPLRMLGETKGKTDHGGSPTRRTVLPAIHSTSCCITNEWRFFGALAEYLFSYDDAGLYVNLYTAGKVKHVLPDGAAVDLSIDTDYPFGGGVVLRAGNPKPSRYALHLRIPRWCRSATIAIGTAGPKPAAPGSYATIDRTWNAGDSVRLQMEMPVRMILPDPREKDNVGQAVLARGPLVYCLEQEDADFPIRDASWDVNPESAATRVRVQWKPELLGGVNVLVGPGLVGSGASAAHKPLTLIPYYARANRAADSYWVTYLPLAN